MMVAKYAYMCDLRMKEEAIANCHLCLVCHLHHINEHPSAFKATNFRSALIASTQNNAWYDRSTNFFELEVNVPRTIGVLRDGTLKYVHNNDNFIPSLFKVQYSGKEFNFKKICLQDKLRLNKHKYWENGSSLWRFQCQRLYCGWKRSQTVACECQGFGTGALNAVC